LSRVWVVDASVGVKPYLPEDLSESAKRLFRTLRAGKVDLFVPDLFYSECANIFVKYVRRFNTPPAHARESLMNLRSLPLLSTSGSELFTSAFNLALDHGISAYDASYLALAQKLSAPVITADEKLIRKLAGSGADIHWLGDLPS
jgi:predicted nucleic acid-binding protein